MLPIRYTHCCPSLCDSSLQDRLLCNHHVPLPSVSRLILADQRLLWHLLRLTAKLRGCTGSASSIAASKTQPSLICLRHSKSPETLLCNSMCLFQLVCS